MRTVSPHLSPALRPQNPRGPSAGSPVAALRLTVLAVVLLTGPIPLVFAQQPTVVDVQKEYNVKGAYIYSFGRYAKWPVEAFANEHDPFLIGVVGTAPLDPILQRIGESKTINGRKVAIHQYATIEDAQFCHILFVSRSVPVEDQQLLLARSKNSSTLSVGETQGFTEWGGVINFVLQQDSVKFEINVQAAREKQISIDAKLLRLAKLVGEQG
jgi:hypothetical protein